jgi:predicted permease
MASIIVLGCMTALLGFLAWLLKLGGKDSGAFMLTMFPNLGNFGLPVILFGLGQEGLAFGIVVMVIGSALQNSFGLYFAQRAYHGKRKAFLKVFLFPMIYAFFLALILRQTGVNVPLPVSRAVALLADAAIPVQLVLLGIQVAETNIERSKPVFVASAARLLAGPAFGIIAAMATGLTGLAGQAFVLQMSGPVAVSMAAYGVQFDVAPRFLSSTVAWTFFFGVFTISVILYFLAYLPV